MQSPMPFQKSSMDFSPLLAWNGYLSDDNLLWSTHIGDSTMKLLQKPAQYWDERLVQTGLHL